MSTNREVGITIGRERGLTRRGGLLVVVGMALAAAGAWGLFATGWLEQWTQPRSGGIEIVTAPQNGLHAPGADHGAETPLAPEGVTDPAPTPEPEPAQRPVDAPDPAPDPAPEALPEPDAAPVVAPEVEREDPAPEVVDAPVEPAVDLVAVQQQLRDLRLLVGAADGVEGPQTRAAVMAFQRVHGLQVDGIVGPQTLGALGTEVEPELRGGPGTRIELELTRQLLHLVEDGQRITTMHVSSGNGQPYTTASGGTARANTPVGEFVIERRISGVRTAPLGILYDPLYFHRGWAIHGSNSVPNHPASHGCIRVTRADARWLFERVPDGIPVHLHGGQYVFTPSR